MGGLKIYVRKNTAMGGLKMYLHQNTEWEALKCMYTWHLDILITFYDPNPTLSK